MIILHIKLHFIYKCQLNWDYHQYSLGILETRFMFSNKSVIPSPGLAWCPRIMSFKEVFIEARERWNWAIVHGTKQKATDSNHKREKHQTPLFWGITKFRGPENPQPYFELLPLLPTPLCLFPPKQKCPAAACLTSILKTPHLMLRILQGIINLLDNEVKLF